MKKVVLTVISFAIAIGLIIGVIIPLAERGRTEGTNVQNQINAVDGKVNSISAPIGT